MHVGDNYNLNLKFPGYNAEPAGEQGNTIIHFALALMLLYRVFIHAGSVKSQRELSMLLCISIY